MAVGGSDEKRNGDGDVIRSVKVDCTHRMRNGSDTGPGSGSSMSIGEPG